MSDRLMCAYVKREIAAALEMIGRPSEAETFRKGAMMMDEAARRKAEGDAPRPHLDKGPGYTHSDPAETCCNPAHQTPDYDALLLATENAQGPWARKNAAGKVRDAIEALLAERDAAWERCKRVEARAHNALRDAVLRGPG